MSDSARQTPAKKMTFAHRLYTGEFQFDFMSRRNWWYIISGILVVISLLAISVRGLNLGIDFIGGSVFQAPTEVNSSTVSDFSDAASNSGVADLNLQVNTVGDDTVRIQTRSLSTAEVVQMRDSIAEQAQIGSDDVAYSLIGPSWGKQITKQAVVALLVFIVLVGVLILVYFREWRMSVSALVALVHDLIITVGLYALAGFTVTPATVIAVLTILGYSLYDTVVVFDMAKEQTRDIKNQDRTYSQAANAAINKVLVRSINTTLIAVLPVAAILIAGLAVLGGEGPLADLGLAMLIGMICGAYSSIFLATPMLTQLREREPDMVKHRKALEKGRRRTKPKVTAAVSPVSDQVDAAGIPSTALPLADGVLGFASASDEADLEPESAKADHSGNQSSQVRAQPNKKSRSARTRKN